MLTDKLGVVLPILLITLGAGWLLTTLGIAPAIDWVWTLGLAVAGMLTLGIGGVDKVTIVLGPFLIIASCLSVLRQTERLPVNAEVPILVMVAGVLLLVARLSAVPAPKWILPEADRTRRD
ncbi:MAG TPA: hypothetical protein VG713_19340 [Pirellulales bacterium]|nr:hypothetical protein [Pirellulales bacterium]